MQTLVWCINLVLTIKLNQVLLEEVNNRFYMFLFWSQKLNLKANVAFYTKSFRYFSITSVLTLALIIFSNTVTSSAILDFQTTQIKINYR